MLSSDEKVMWEKWEEYKKLYPYTFSATREGAERAKAVSSGVRSMKPEEFKQMIDADVLFHNTGGRRKQKTRRKKQKTRRKKQKTRRKKCTTCTRGLKNKRYYTRKMSNRKYCKR